MDIGSELSHLIVKDFKEQNVQRLSQWFERFPESLDFIEKEIKAPPIQYAIRGSMWLSLAFILSVVKAARKTAQVQEGVRSEDSLCMPFLKAHISNLDSSKMEVLKHLQERVRL